MKRQVILTMVVFVFAFITSVRASQQPSDTNDLQTLPDYLRYASLNNAGLKAKFEEWKAALEQVPQAKSLDDPKFTYSYFIEEVETRVGPQRQKFGIMQVFPWFGEIEARTDAATASAKAARKQYESAKLKLFFEVKVAFYEYAYLSRAVQIARENLELVKHFEEVARTKYMAAAAGHPDVIRAQVELATIEDVLKSLEDFRNPIVSRLNAVLNRRSFEMLPWPRKEKIRKVEVERQQMIALLRQLNPELAALDFEVEAAKHRVELAKKKFYPDIGVGLDWVQTDRALSAGTPDSSKDPVILMFTLNLPIWRDSYTAAQLQAKANVNKTAQQTRETENTLIARAERVLYDFEDTGRKMELYGDILVPKAEELLGASETAYRAGTIDFLSLIDAQRMLLKYQLLWERAITNNVQKLAELEMLTGAELPPANQEPPGKN